LEDKTLEKKVKQKREDKGKNYIKQAGILAIAGVLVRIIGMLYRSPLYRVIGQDGNGLYAMSYNIYALILMISAYSIPSALSKAMAGKLTFHEYKNANRIFRCSLVYVMIVGAVASGFTFFVLPNFLDDSRGTLVLQVFAPVIFFQGILGVLRGYFQARKDMTKTSISQILEQIFNAFGSVGFAYLLTMSLKAGTDKHSIRGAMGSALGTGLGVVVAMLLMIFIYLHYSKEEKELIKQDTSEIEPYSKIFKMIFSTVTPFIMSTFIYNVSISSNQKIFQKFMLDFNNVEATVTTGQYSWFSNAVVFATIPIAMASAMAASLVPNLAGAMEEKNLKKAKDFVNTSFRVIMLIAIPMAVGLSVFAREIIQSFFPREGVKQTSNILVCLLFGIIFASVSTLTNSVLQAIGKLHTPVINASIALVLQTVVLVLFIDNFDAKYGVYGLVVAYTVYYFFVCVLNARGVKKHLGYSQDILNVYARPLVSAVVMGILGFYINKGMRYLELGIIIRLVVGITLSVIIYGIAIAVFKAVDEKILLNMPMGARLVKVYKKFNLIK